MKGRILTGILTLTLLAGSAYAENNGSPGDGMIRHMKETLSLSDEQVSKLQEAFASRKEKGEGGFTAEEREEMQNQISSILTDEQREKYNELKEARKSGPGEWNGGARGHERRKDMASGERKEFKEKRQDFWNNLSDEEKAEFKEHRRKGGPGPRREGFERKGPQF